MYTEASIMVAGWISNEPEFTVNKKGLPFCRFVIATTNKTSSDGTIMYFNCFLWPGKQYDLVKQLCLTIKDEVVVRGMFSSSIRSKNDGTQFLNLHIYVEHIQVIRSAAAEKAMVEANSNGFKNIPVQQRNVKKINNQELEIDKKDNPWG